MTEADEDFEFFLENGELELAAEVVQKSVAELGEELAVVTAERVEE